MSTRNIRGPLKLNNTTVFTTAGNVSLVNESALVVLKASGAATQVTLPAPQSGVQGRVIFIKDGKGDAATNNITIIPDGVVATTIDGAASFVLSNNFAGATLLYNGTEWGVVTVSAPGINGLATQTSTNAITAFAGGGQSSAVALTTTLNRVTVCATAADSVKLPTSAAGQMVEVTNAGAAALAVFPATGDAINSLAANGSTLVPPGYTAQFWCAVAGTWNTIPLAPREVNTTLTTVGAGIPLAAGIVGGLITRTGPVAAFTDTTDTAAAIIAVVPGAAVGQSWEFTYVNNCAFVGTFVGGASVTLTMLGGGTLTVPPNSWARFLVRIATASTVTMQCLAQGPNSPLPLAKFTTMNATTGTLAAGAASGAAVTSLMSTNATPGNQAMRTPAQILGDTPGISVGSAWLLRITATGANALTLTTDGGSGFTMTGTMTVAQNTFRDFVVTITAATTGTVQSIGTGTYS